jgi:hypothetical protein
MNSNPKQRADQTLEAIIRKVSASGDMPQALTEEDLWGYALGLLEPDEESQMLTRITCSETAKAELKRIQKSMAVAIAPPFKERVAATLARMGLDPSRLAAVVARIDEGLVSLFDDLVRGKVTGVVMPVTAGAAAIAEPKVEQQKKFVIELPEGSRLVIVARPEGIADVILETRPALEEGKRVRLLQLIEGEQDWDWKPLDEVRVTKGTARFADCPSGILRIQISARSFVEFYLTSENE